MRELDQGGDELAAGVGVLDALGQRHVDLRDVGPQELEAEQGVGAAREVVEGDLGAALAVRLDQLGQHVAVGAALGPDQLDADVRRVGVHPRHDGPGGAHGRLDVERGARVEVDEQHLALGQHREADLERRGAGPVVEGEQRVVGLGGGQQLAAADLDGSELAAHQRLAAVGAAGGQLHDRLEVRLHLAVREEVGEPVGARAVEQRLGGQRDRLLVVHAQREQARALGRRDGLQQLLQALAPAGAGEHEAVDGDVALHRLGGQVLDLVEHGRTVRQQSHSVDSGGLGAGHPGRDRPKPAARLTFQSR